MQEQPYHVSGDLRLIHFGRFCVSRTLKNEAVFLLTGMDIAAFKAFVLGFPFHNDDVFQRHILC